MPEIFADRVTPFPSAARTATANSQAQRLQGHRGIRVYLNVSAASGTTPTLDMQIQVRHRQANTWFTPTGWAFAQITGTTATPVTFVIYPGAIAVANGVINQPAPDEFRLRAVIGGTTPSFTFAAEVEKLP